MLTSIGMIETVYIGGLTAANQSFLRRCFSDNTASSDMGSAMPSGTSGLDDKSAGGSASLLVTAVPAACALVCGRLVR